MSKTDEKWNRLMDDMALHPLAYCKRRGIDLSWNLACCLFGGN